MAGTCCEGIFWGRGIQNGTFRVRGFGSLCISTTYYIQKQYGRYHVTGRLVEFGGSHSVIVVALPKDTSGPGICNLNNKRETGIRAEAPGELDHSSRGPLYVGRKSDSISSNGVIAEK